jgi:hypothetical protein
MYEIVEDEERNVIVQDDLGHCLKVWILNHFQFMYCNTW